MTETLTPHERLVELSSRLIVTRAKDRETLLLAAGQLRDIITDLHDRADHRGSIVQVVARFFGVSEGHLFGRARTRACAEPRRVAMYLMREETSMTLSAIGRMFNRDHTTVIYGVQTVKDEIMRNPSFARNLDMLRTLLAKEAAKDDS
tara:strand:+ start:406 stop:849 length:444 start_codon:yes stop_codon:yes gene_type:complete